MELQRYVASTAIGANFLFCFAGAKPALMPTPLFEGSKVHSHTALFITFLFFIFVERITKVVDPVPESMWGVGGGR